MSQLITNNLLIDTTNDPIPLTELGYRVIKTARATYDGGQWNPTTTYNWIPGMFNDYTPLLTTSRVRMTCMIPFARNSGAAHAISSWIFYANSVEQGRHAVMGEHYEDMCTYVWDCASWGATAVTSANATISGTTFTAVGQPTGGAAAFSVGQQLTGTGVALGTIITAGPLTGSAGSPGATWTVNQAQTVTATTITGILPTSGRIGYQMRAHGDDNHEIRPYCTQYWDGGGSVQVCRGQYVIEEYLVGV
jgi:hypothetical protein